MIQKVLVATDLSKSSKAGIRFAIQLASQQRTKLIFYHVMHTAMPTSFSQEKFMLFVEEQVRVTTAKLTSFVAAIYRQMGLVAKKPECIVEFKPFVDSAIIEYAVSRRVDFICMSTRGAGIMKRILGTNTSSVLSQSPIPVLAVPHDYRRSRVSHILYASDLTALSEELKQVKKFADASKSRLSVIHYGSALEPSQLRRNLQRVEKQYRSSRVSFSQEKYGLDQSMADQLKEAVKKIKPSVLAVFTKQDKSLLERVFPQSNSEKLSFDSRKPLLVFPK
jgi:nucleotide-binding universal stress UspA family protein